MAKANDPRLIEPAVLPLNTEGSATDSTQHQIKSVPPPRPILPGESVPVVPGYTIEKSIGKGGMGVVYLARNVMMNRLEVLKVVGRNLLSSAEARERFLREIRSAANLQHPNVVVAYSAIQVADQLVFAMEYVDGQDLDRIVESQGPLSVRAASYYIYYTALGLQHAFERGMVHRDIKPSNLIVAKLNGKPAVKILDFGLAKASSENHSEPALTSAGVMMGTPGYMAPEQFLDAAKCDIRADIYSLGCTLYHLLAGAMPFPGPSIIYYHDQHSTAKAKPLHELRPEVPPALSAIVAKMMAKAAADRYAKPGDVALALAPFIRSTTVPLKPESKELPAVKVVKPTRDTAPPKLELPADPMDEFVLADQRANLIPHFEQLVEVVPLQPAAKVAKPPERYFSGKIPPPGPVPETFDILQLDEEDPKPPPSPWWKVWK